MPIYEYRCEKCNKVFEEHQSVHDKPLEHCKYCKGKVKKILSPAGIVFKGPGFHVTDYGKKQGGTDQKTAPSTETKK